MLLSLGHKGGVNCEVEGRSEATVGSGCFERRIAVLVT